MIHWLKARSMNRRICRMVLFHDCPILDRSPSRGTLRFKVGEDSGGGGSCNGLERYLPRNAFAASWAAPIFRRECEDRWDRRTTESVHHTYPASRLRAYTTTLGINEIACGLVSGLNQIHEPQCQLRFNSQLALIDVQFFKRSGDPGQVGG